MGLAPQIHANCRIRRVYFSDRLYSEDELPAEFKLYLPVQNKAKVRHLTDSLLSRKPGLQRALVGSAVGPASGKLWGARGMQALRSPSVISTESAGSVTVLSTSTSDPAPLERCPAASCLWPSLKNILHLNLFISPKSPAVNWLSLMQWWVLRCLLAAHVGASPQPVSTQVSPKVDWWH